MSKSSGKYTALYLLDPCSALTKSKFSRISDAEKYIKSQIWNEKRFLLRANWLIIETKTLDRHLTNLEEQIWTKQKSYS